MNQTLLERIIRAMEAAARGILTASGYNTDMGLHVQVAREDLAETDLPGLVLWVGKEDPAPTYGAGFLSVSVTVLGLMIHGAEVPGYLAPAMLADLKEALCAPVLSLPFSGGAVPVSVGDTLAGATSGAGGYVGGVTVAGGSWAGGDAAGVLSLRRLTGSGLFLSGEALKVSGSPVAQAAGAGTPQTPEARVCGGLAKSIQYTGGGADEYPAAGRKITGVTAGFTVLYRHRPGDSYNL